MWRVSLAIPMILSIALVGCGDDSPAAPPAQTLVGTWAATSVDIVSVDDGSVRVDLVSDLGATLTLTLAEGGDFTMVLDYPNEGPGGPWGGDQTITGTWSSTDVLTLQTSPNSQWQFEAVLSGMTLTLSGADTSFDFGGDGTIEDAKLGMALVHD